MKDTIDEHLGLGPKHAVPSVEVIPPTRGQDQDIIKIAEEDDYEFARRNLREMIQQGRESLEMIQEVADASESPMAYDVVAKMIDKLAKASESLLEIGKKRREGLEPNGSTPEKVINNTQTNVYVGSAADLLKTLKPQEED